ncbi:hypothetical protein OS189_04085 [Sulfitobacter sp. F26169L]|uniref:hypothetical protein n=1 Tax=Sulfitobacter sp. F26169L TaxID=2996015 RepID=UPI002260C4C5|nr:hypothetical protein [Sulfitobacter sp. F26169L]MCX7565522.1 hypothetical protein [Sulfitobacter sp. F26169L]
MGQGANYTDCFETALADTVTLSEFFVSFYTSPLFRLERQVLQLFLQRRISDAQVHLLAMGDADVFAVWRVEARRLREILLCDAVGHTRSCLRVEAHRLVFGSAVVARQGQGPGIFIKLTTPLHRLYSRALLRAAVRRIGRQ